MDRNRQLVLGGLLALFAVLSLVTLFEIVNVVVFAITVAYVLYPLRRWLANRGLSNRLASAASTVVAFLAVVVLIAPLVYVVNERRNQLIAALDRIPETVPIAIGDVEFVVETAPFVNTAEGIVRDLAVALALAAPGLVLGLAVFTLLLYGILYRPRSVRTALYELVPPSYHDVLARLHRRTSNTLFSIYIVQALTALATFLIAAVVFYALGYEAVLSLAAIAGILQFVPIVGPSILVTLLALNDLVVGVTTRAILVLVFGLVFVSFVPDAVVRTQLAGRAGELASSLYFVGFVGGILTVGAIGIIVGPLVVALLVEVVALLSERESPQQTTLDDREREPTGVGHGSEQKSP